MRVSYERLENLYERITLIKGDKRIQYLFSYHETFEKLSYREVKAIHVRRLRKELNSSVKSVPNKVTIERVEAYGGSFSDL